MVALGNAVVPQVVEVIGRAILGASTTSTPIPAATHLHPPGCPDPDWCRGNRECRWDCCGKECETEEASHE